MAEPSGLRAKLYKLEDGQWEDAGTGNVNLDEETESYTLISETPSSDGENEIVISMGVSKEKDHYTVQGNGILCWRDGITQDELALSFETTEGCQKVLDFLNKIRAGLPPLVPLAEAEESRLDDTLESADGEVDDGMGAEFSLPVCSIAGLSDLADAFDSLKPNERSLAASYILEKDYIPQLIDMFERLEDLESEDSLGHIYRIMKGMALLGEESVFEVLLSDANFTRFVGSMEYDPDLPPGTGKFRKFLATKSRFIELIRVENEDVIRKIHLNYRLTFLKDVLLPRVLDDMSFASVNSIVLRNSISIASFLKTNDSYLASLCKGAADTSDIKQQRQYMHLLDEIVQLAKSLGSSPPSLFDALLENGFIAIMNGGALFSKSRKVRQIAVDTLHETTSACTEAIRASIVESLASHSGATVDEMCLLGKLLHVLASDSEVGIQTLAADVICQLLESESVGSSNARSKLIERWYDMYMCKMLELVTKTSHSWVSQKRSVECIMNARYLSSELIVSFLQTHDFRIKYLILKQNLLAEMLKSCKEPGMLKWKHIILSIIRIFKSCVRTKEDFYFKYISQNNIINLLFDILDQHLSRKNLITAAILDVLQFLRSIGKYSILEPFVQKREATLQALSKQGITLADDLMQRCKPGGDGEEKGKDGESNGALANVARPPPANVRRDMEDDDDRYLESGEEPQSSTNGATSDSSKAGINHSAPLVHYDDDDDDGEEFGPPLPSRKRAAEEEDDSLVLTGTKRSLTDRSPKKKFEIVNVKRQRVE
uniref:Serine/threonine-protein phosphatase 4 regulatory subunit 3-like central domain-containing protein n=1 Tax=Palpitomonas bilix TaxID=652834 RepID=A0A7S3DFB2_9EUKA|mmetsp:Transcript_35241/g.91539  ORF Transcript_35241/g.91539 Transcript_35241/m.91539 type:complete len:774 (+) Transcript_35241:217-2538(+)|eukprot:CAMPEP_0113872702 /NCGR_PEP_ID=MMETSP0780_2-20120614/3361_1 /TAXON_ID=652834 /ORGANISM="Palpitomonas bilix" /LENGTH=773 /DNA_ID=CAMNT_0000858265 /DNA_START=156 /DNA_END=2477 /DNA_ORIENTATION=- /assembly_acc=CAM_ASM_000599